MNAIRFRGGGFRRIAGYVALALPFATHAPVQAQEPPVLAGSTVRLTSVAAGIGVKVGTVQSIGPDTLRLRDARSGTDLSIPVESIRALWVSDGWKNQMGKGAVFGLLAGSIAGGVTGLALQEICQARAGIVGGECGGEVGVGVLIGAPVGLLVGTVVGARIRTRRWRSVALPLSRGGLRLEIGTEGPAVSLSWTP